MLLPYLSHKLGGNASQWGEANAEYDPEATQIVLSSGEDVPITMYASCTTDLRLILCDLRYPWDVYLDVAFSHSELSYSLGGI